MTNKNTNKTFSDEIANMLNELDVLTVGEKHLLDLWDESDFILIEDEYEAFEYACNPYENYTKYQDLWS